MITIAKTVKVHDLDATATIHTLKRNDDQKTTFYSVTLLSNNIICAGDDNGKVFVWDTRTPEKPIFSSCDCEQYISGIDGRYEGRRIFVCSSGEGTLTAYDLRANKMIEPQSELFEAGFQCVKMVDANRKVVVGGEDGAIYVFNQGEWAHTSGKFSFTDDPRNSGKSSIEGIDVLPDNSTFLTASSDGRLRALSLWPHKVVGSKTVCKRNSLDTIQVSPHDGGLEVLVGGDKYINLLSYEDKPEDDDSGSDSSSSGESSDDENDGSDVERANGKTRPHTHLNNNSKKLKANTEDYLNIFE